MKKLYLLFSFIFFVSVFEGIAVAEENVTDFGSATPTKNQLIDALTPLPQVKTRGITRSIRPVQRAEAVIAKPVAVNLSLTFGFDTATLTKETKTSLNALGEAMKDPKLSANQFRIEGHTDGIGQATYNKNLSKKRANSVKKYLATNYGISSDRLVIIGKGEEDLLDWGNPGSSVNRRVKIVNLGTEK